MPSVITSIARTPLGRFGGAFLSLPAVDLGGTAVAAALERSGLPAAEVQAVYLGHVIQALRAPVVTQALLYGAPALLVGWLLLTIWRPTRVEEDES